MKIRAFSNPVGILCLVVVQTFAGQPSPVPQKGERKHMSKVKVGSVKKVEIALLKSKPPKLSIKAEGEVPTGGWSAAELVAFVYVQPPPDGIYDFDFVAEPPPAGSAVTQVVSPISAEKVLETIPEGLRGVRIHAASNQKEAML
jgi:hypothetical protein